jgi:hypothetical protein
MQQSPLPSRHKTTGTKQSVRTTAGSRTNMQSSVNVGWPEPLTTDSMPCILHAGVFGGPGSRLRCLGHSLPAVMAGNVHH